jgi:hypothetical protein
MRLFNRQRLIECKLEKVNFVSQTRCHIEGVNINLISTRWTIAAYKLQRNSNSSGRVWSFLKNGKMSWMIFHLGRSRVNNLLNAILNSTLLATHFPVVLTREPRSPNWKKQKQQQYSASPTNFKLIAKFPSILQLHLLPWYTQTSGDTASQLRNYQPSSSSLDPGDLDQNAYNQRKIHLWSVSSHPRLPLVTGHLTNYHHRGATAATRDAETRVQRALQQALLRNIYEEEATRHRHCQTPSTYALEPRATRKSYEAIEITEVQEGTYSFATGRLYQLHKLSIRKWYITL